MAKVKEKVDGGEGAEDGGADTATTPKVEQAQSPPGVKHWVGVLEPTIVKNPKGQNVGVRKVLAANAKPRTVSAKSGAAQLITPGELHVLDPDVLEELNKNVWYMVKTEAEFHDHVRAEARAEVGG